MLIMAACSSNAYDQELEGHQLIAFPVVLNGLPQEAGAGEEVAPPTCLYLWAVLNMKAEGQTEAKAYLFHRRVDNGTWNHFSSPTSEGSTDSINSLVMQVRLDVGASKRFRIPVGETAADDGTFTVGYVYALASKFDIDELLPTHMTDSMQVVEGGMEEAIRRIEDITLDLTNLEESLASGVELDGLPQGELGFSQFLSTLYSTPSALRLQSAQVISRPDNFYLLQSAPQLQLAPCASLVECSWDLPEDAQNPVSSITLHNLPTQLRLFVPTANPEASTYECLMLSNSLTEGVHTLSPDSRYKGQTSAYVLQPPNGCISYTMRLANGQSHAGTSTRLPNNQYVIKVVERQQ